MIADFGEIEAFAGECLQKAMASARAIQFSVTENYSKEAGSLRAKAEHYGIGSNPRFMDIGTAGGVGGWAAVLSVDLRHSSKIAIESGPKDTFQIIHTYLPTMVELVARADGLIGGLRGDGLFAMFGFTEYEDSQRRALPAKKYEDAVSVATRCGKAMIEATTEIINPLLRSVDLDSNLQIGVGIEVGDVVVTKIGIGDAVEHTLYGVPVNHACKAATGCNEVILAKGAHNTYPTSKDGKVTFGRRNLGGDLGGFVFVPPPGYRGLAGARPMFQPSVPRTHRPRPR